MSTIEYTQEQIDIFTVMLESGENLAVIAYAGTGKTATMIEAVRRYIKKNPNAKIAMIYFNKAAKADAEARIAALGLESNVSIWTNHTIPFVAIGQKYANNHRLLGINDRMCKRWQSKDIADYLAIDDFDATIDGKPYHVKAEQIAQFAQKTVNQFTTTSDWKLTEWNVPRIPALEEIMPELKPVIVAAANALWKDKRSPKNGKVSITHDDYLKMFSMSSDDWYPRKTMLISDEYQDTNPAQFAILRRHCAMRQVGVGDPYQAIYGFRNSKDYLRKFNEIKRKGTPVPHQTKYLTKTWRNGGEVVEQANKWLAYCEAEMPMIGNDAVDSRIVEDMTDPDLYLTRSNSGAILAALEMLALNRTYSVHGGSDAIKEFANGAAQLMAGEPTDHPELLGFMNWDHFVKFTEEDPAGTDLRRVQRIITKHGVNDIIRLADNAMDEGEAETHIATTHTQKGRQAKKVKVCSDFERMESESGEKRAYTMDEAYLAYVAVTRAELELDQGPLQDINDIISLDNAPWNEIREDDDETGDDE